MADFTPIKLHLKEAQYLADLVGIQQDLIWVKLSKEHYEKAFLDQNMAVLEAIFIASLVKYSRIYKSGIRSKNIGRHLIKSFSIEDRNVHDYAINLRDKFIAHSVNNYEKNDVTVFIQDMKTSPKFNQVSCQHTRVLSISDDFFNKFVMLADKCLMLVDKNIAVEKELLTKMVRDIPVGVLIKKDFPEFLEKDDVAVPRKKRFLKYDNNL